MTDDDLDLVETERLVDALYRRTGSRGHLALVLEQDLGCDESAKQVWYRPKEADMAALGLLDWGKWYLRRQKPIRFESGDGN